MKERKYKEFLWMLPLLPLTASAYVAGRNAYLGYVALAFILAFLIKRITLKILIPICLLISIYAGFLIQQKLQPPPLYYPVAASRFLQQHHLQGNMFNEYEYGGYLLYQLYPQYHVFIDGRSDVYLDREMPVTLDIANKKNLPDNEFASYMYQHIWNPYHISFVILRTEKHSLIRKITRLLNTDPQWTLIFWDDTTQIFVRKDGKNNKILSMFGAQYATPYLQNPFVKGKEKDALSEYAKMDSITKSSHASNAIGLILLKQGNIEMAKKRFEEAISLSQQFESPYMNLAEIYAYNSDYQQAIELYQQAQRIAPDRGLIYIRLGQLYMQGLQDKDNARKAWEMGESMATDDNDKKQLQNLLSTLQ